MKPTNLKEFLDLEENRKIIIKQLDKLHDEYCNYLEMFNQKIKDLEVRICKIELESKKNQGK